MRDGLFFAISRVNILFLQSVKEFADILIAISTAMTNALLGILDKERMDHAISAIQQNEEITELNILNSIEEVRDDAIRHGSWNEEHEGRLSFLGTMLYNDHDWEEEQVYRYIGEVIATGPAISSNE